MIGVRLLHKVVGNNLNSIFVTQFPMATKPCFVRVLVFGFFFFFWLCLKFLLVSITLNWSKSLSLTCQPRESHDCCIYFPEPPLASALFDFGLIVLSTKGEHVAFRRLFFPRVYGYSILKFFPNWRNNFVFSLLGNFHWLDVSGSSSKDGKSKI